MFKVKLNNEIVDALEYLQCVFYSHKSGMILRCGKEDIPEGIISFDQEYIWHVEGWPDLPEGYETVQLIEIDEEEYKTLRAILDDGKQVEEPEPDPVPEPEDDADELAWAKQKKINVSKALLAKFLEEHPLMTNVHGGYVGTYAVTAEKQNLMSMNYSTYMIKKQAGLDPVLTWNQTGEECEVWTEEEFLTLIVQVEAYVKPLVAAQQHYEAEIKRASSLKEVSGIEIVYEISL